MSVLYSLYDALVSINVPNDKARSVVEAMEMDMLDKLATKADLDGARALLTKDIEAAELRMDRKLSDLGDKLTVRMAQVAVATITAVTGLVSLVQYVLR